MLGNSLTEAALLLAKRLAGPVMDEMQFGTGRADDRRVTVFLVLWHVRQPMLHVQAGAGAFEKNWFHDWRILQAQADMTDPRVSPDP
jgi:hypothetical protein